MHSRASPAGLIGPHSIRAGPLLKVPTCRRVISPQAPAHMAAPTHPRGTDAEHPPRNLVSSSSLSTPPSTPSSSPTKCESVMLNVRCDSPVSLDPVDVAVRRGFRPEGGGCEAASLDDLPLRAAMSCVFLPQPVCLFAVSCSPPWSRFPLSRSAPSLSSETNTFPAAGTVIHLFHAGATSLTVTRA